MSEFSTARHLCVFPERAKGTTMRILEPWEDRFREDIEKIDETKRQKAGALLPVIPCHEDWDKFLDSAKMTWADWRRDMGQFPYCLIVLYGGLAYYKYDVNTFWPQFAEAVGEAPLPTNQRSEVNDVFAKAAKTCGLKIRQRSHGTDYVGSAVHLIGVPLSLWDGFLEICEWALSWDNWTELSNEEWSNVLTKRAGSRTRLKNFLLDNRDTTSAFIQEMHDARKILTEDQSLTIGDLQQASLLRQEYFDDVPETAEFLRPEDPDSLIKDRARLVWDEGSARISLYLPAVSLDKLPATWKIGALTQEAASTPDVIILNAEAFVPSLVLKLESGQQRISGIAPWRLFDLDRTRFVDSECRQQFPIHSYAIISRKPLDDIQRKGFGEEDNPINDLYELEDGTSCYVTRLWPVEKQAELSVTHAGVTKKLTFRPQSKIEARIFAGEGNYAANFCCYNERLKLERLPLLCIAIPFGSFQDTETVLRHKFLVHVGEQLAEGIWEKRHEDDRQEFYFWRWGDELQPRKKVTVFVKSPGLGIKFDYQIEMLLPKDGMDECWQNLPGAFLPWVLLAQPAVGTKEGMKWNDLLLAKEAIAPEQQLSPYRLRKYEKHGLLKQCGVRWLIAESRAIFEPAVAGECNLRFCGNPAVLWSLFRYMSDKTSDLPIIEVIHRHGELPFLSMRWKEEQKTMIEKFLKNKNHNVRFVSNLWS